MFFLNKKQGNPRTTAAKGERQSHKRASARVSGGSGCSGFQVAAFLQVAVCAGVQSIYYGLVSVLHILSGCSGHALQLLQASGQLFRVAPNICLLLRFLQPCSQGLAIFFTLVRPVNNMFFLIPNLNTQTYNTITQQTKKKQEHVTNALQ